ncbi:methyltransferase domain-containing protein [Candidatus Uhrbacteria bacterium]|nr:methyltransferase domain-containing protein [Candidatus Uhrbacteria bacterium]
MSSSIFILGREFHLSIAELVAALHPYGPQWNRALVQREVLVVPTDRSVDPAFLGRLGGTIKMGTVWREVPYGGFDGSDEAIGAWILEQVPGTRKLHFGYSVYDGGAGPAKVATVRAALRRGAPAQKRWLAEHGRSVRWVTAQTPTLSSVVVEKNHLFPPEGVEVLVLVTPEHLLLGVTHAVQPFEEWSARDYGRPGRDARSGMLPPKLARIMLQLAGVPPEGTVLDPFCGSGTVLTEAMMLGIAQAVGTDLSAKAIADAEQNVAWVRARTPAATVVNLRVADARAVDQVLLPRSVDAVVTEPYLGPSQRSASGDATTLSILYRDAFRSFARVVKPGGRVVFVAPVFRSMRGARAIDVTDAVRAFGFHRMSSFPTELQSHPLLRDREDLPYARADQRVGRRILVFRYAP